MAKHYKYQKRKSVRNQNGNKRLIGTREFTIKKVERIGDDVIKLTFEGGTRHTIKSYDAEYRYNYRDFWLLSKCLAVGDKARVEYDKVSRRIISCDLNFEVVQRCDQSLTMEPDWEKQILTLTYLSEGKTDERVLDSSIKFLDRFEENEFAFDEAKDLAYIVEGVIFISGRLAGVICW